MSAQVYSVPGQTEGRSKAFLEWKSIDLSHRLIFISFHRIISYIWHNVNYYKSVHQPVPTLENREHPGNFRVMSVTSSFN